MTRPQAVTLGPFLGGLNLLADTKFVADDELIECINFEVDLDGSLMSRPAITETINNEGWGFERFIPIGRVSFTTGGDYIIVSSPQGTHAFDGSEFIFIDGCTSRCAVQYLDNVYIIADTGSPSNGGRWDGTTFTLDASMPRGEAAVFHKSRLFVVPGKTATTNPSRLYFTDVITSTTLSWPGTNNIDIQPGDGNNLIDLVIYNDNLVLFKENSIYLLAYDIRPTDAVLRQVISGIGATHPHCVDTHDNSVFFLHEGKVWEMSNYEFTHVNQKVPFVLDEVIPVSEKVPGNGDYVEPGGARLDPIWLRKMGDRILVGFHAKRYSYHLLTRTWGEWQMEDATAAEFGPPLELIQTRSTNEPVRYYCATVMQEWGNFYYFTDRYVEGTRDSSGQGLDGWDGFVYRNIICTIRTKDYDFDIPLVWKRLMWWGPTLYLGPSPSTGGPVQGYPIPNKGAVDNDLWEDVALHTWENLGGDWGNFLFESYPTDVIIDNTLSTGSSFYKFRKSLRFRSIAFKVIMKNDGTTPDGPCRFMTITAIVGLKQVVGKDMNA